MVLALIPKRYQHIAKLIVAIVGLTMTLAPIIFADNLEAVAGVGAVLTALGVWGVPNKPEQVSSSK